MKKFWNLVKDMSLLIFSLGYALMWIFDKLATIRHKNGKNANKFEIAGFISYMVGLANSIIYLIS